VWVGGALALGVNAEHKCGRPALASGIVVRKVKAKSATSNRVEQLLYF